MGHLQNKLAKAAQKGWGQGDEEALRGIVKNRPGMVESGNQWFKNSGWGDVVRNAGRYIPGSKYLQRFTGGGESQADAAARPIAKGLDREQLAAQRRQYEGVRDYHGSHVRAGVGKYIKGQSPGWDTVTGKMNTRAQGMQNLMQAVSEDDEVAGRMGLGGGGMVNEGYRAGMANQDIVGKTRQEQALGIKRMWDKNKGWIVPAGIGLGGIALLSMFGSGQDQAQGQAPPAPPDGSSLPGSWSDASNFGRDKFKWNTTT